MYHKLQIHNTCNTIYPRNMVCVRYIIVNTLHKGDDKDNKNNCKECHPVVLVIVQKLEPYLSKTTKFCLLYRTTCFELSQVIHMFGSWLHAEGTAIYVSLYLCYLVVSTSPLHKEESAFSSNNSFY